MKKIVKNVKNKIRAKKLARKKEKVNKELESLNNLTLKKFSKITGLKIPKQYKKMQNIKIEDVSLTVKELIPNCLFFDMGRYEIPPACIDKMRKNALFVVSKNNIEGCNCIVCDNADYYGKKYFNYIRNLVNPKVVAVTGSIGKTSTKDMIASVLKEEYKKDMISSEGNTNTTGKMVKYLKRINTNIKVYIQEVGACGDSKGFVMNSAQVLEPNIAVYTNIKDSHIEFYGSRENIAKEKSDLAKYAKENALVVINYDDEILRNMDFGKTTYSYSLKNPEANFYARNIKITTEGTSFTIVDKIRDKKIAVNLKVIGEHHIINAIVSYIVAKRLKVKNEVIKKGLLNYKTSGIRQNLINIGSYKIFADCYNSSYDALSNTLKSINVMQPKREGQKIAVIGDILELGAISKEIHQKVGKLLSEYDFRKVFFIGEASKDSYQEYKKYKDNSKHFENRNDIIKEINETIQRDDIILFKGSHGMHLYEIIDACFGTKIGEKADMGQKDYITEKAEGSEFFVFKNHATVTKYDVNHKKVNIPNEYKGLNIEKLGNSLFKDNKNIEELIVPKYVSRINDECFSNSNIRKIEFNENMRVIGKEAFLNCKNIEEIILPKQFLIINSKAFANCDNLKKIYIPRLTRMISKDAFLGSNNITIYCEDNSYAKKFAKENNIKYEIVQN